MMDKVLLGDNQFFAVNHLSDEKSREQAIRFKDDSSIIRVLDQAREVGINTFMCTTHDRIGNICDYMRSNQDKYHDPSPGRKELARKDRIDHENHTAVNCRERGRKKYPPPG